MITTRRTVVCRSKGCAGGGWWGEALPVDLRHMLPARCPRCRGPLTELAPTIVVELRNVPR